ncbi:acyl-CoA dehydrogenase family protein [Micromonospora siamensis]|uniref:Acyl-CoA dehydrogenase n=1 Tax=Micromonospora siamensis TaxID=299152 RepID=A0A1C5J805_9ACTN|nr:acyl-CoA dehydrogenase family protein [Micromonospora siamensis]SCG66176.1 Acyl-CoA dehydrogenase [Micromonospora siamensis]
MQALEVPNLVKRAGDLVPLLRRNAAWSEQNRRPADETVEALTAAGILRMRTPQRYGGYECDASTLLDVGIELGRGDGAAAFNTAVWWITSWNMGLFPDEVQDEVFADPDARIAGTIVVNGTGIAKDGGIVVNGEWGFNSGASHSTWRLLSTIMIGPDGQAEPVMAAVPLSAMRVVDDWYASGLSGTGSVTTIAEDVFVPDGHYLRMADIAPENVASKLNAGRPMFRTHLAAVVMASTTGLAIGLARAANEAFHERIGSRPITNTFYERQADAPVTHLQAAEASLKIDEAEFHARKLASMIDEKALTGEAWSLRERAYARAVGGRVPQLAAEAVDILAGACGASSLYTGNPIQRIRRDAHAMTLHQFHLPTSALELYGRVLCGLEPNSFFF